MASARDPFRVLSLSYDADADAVRRAFRRRARETHPDRGGAADAFHEARAAYDALVADLDGQRLRWRPAAPVPVAPVRTAGLDPAVYPTCLVRISRRRDGKRIVEPVFQSRPARWRPVDAPPPGGTCIERVAESGGMPAYGVWRVPLDAYHTRYVFGPHPAGASRAPR